MTDKKRATQAQRFNALFRSYSGARGEFTPTGKSASGKVEGDPRTRHDEGPTATHWNAHLRGTTGLGCLPLLDDGATVAWAALDIDVQGIDHAALEAEKNRQNIPGVVFASKSGGAHLVVFFREDVPASVARARLAEWAERLGHRGCEIFPKQEARAPGDSGNWLNMPYFGGERRAMIGGEWADAEAFLDHAGGTRVSPEQLFGSDPLAEGPPCLNEILRGGGPDRGHRNTFWFNYAVMLRKMYGDGFSEHLFDQNRESDDPLSPKEVQKIAESVSRGEYEGYQCQEQPLCGHCDAATCVTREFGIRGAGDVGRYVYVIGLKRFIDVETGEQFDKEQYDDQHPQPKGSAAKAFMRMGRKVLRTTFCPGGERFAGDALNLWRGNAGLPPDPAGDPAPFLDHLAYLVPEPDERAHLLRWLANVVQRPDRRANHGVMIVGGMGTGKSFIGRVMTQIVGRPYVSTPRTSDVKEKFNGWALAKILVVMDEVMDLGRLEITLRLKEMIADDWVSIRQPYVAPYEVPNYANFLVFTNSDDALKLEDGERRWFIIQSPAVARDAAYYKMLHDWADAGGAAAVAHNLRAFDLGDWNPKAVPPRTAAQVAMEYANLSPDFEAVQDLFTRGDFPFNGPLTVIAEVKEQARLPRRNNNWYVKTIAALGAEKLRQVRLPGLGRPVVYAMRDHDRWRDATDADAEAAAMDRTEAALYPALPDDAASAVRAGEMRAYIRGLSENERLDFLTRQAKAGNLLPLQAAADLGLGMLAEADPEVVAGALRAYAQANRAEDWARLTAGREMHRLLANALGKVIPMAEQMKAPDVENPAHILSRAMTRKTVGDSANPAENLRIRVPA